ncbi:MAG: hypothetical protein QOF53_19 [Nocardioidaceae bacterium]|nr:hypothetical protein [Nocardioidaceae bacterium]
MSGVEHRAYGEVELLAGVLGNARPAYWTTSD